MMLSQTDPGLDRFIIDDGNADFFARQIVDPTTPFHGGFEAEKVVPGLGNPFSRNIIPRRNWSDLIKQQNEKKTSPDHWRLAGGVPIMDQGQWGYCWMYGLGGAMNVAYAQQAMFGLRLNPFYPAFMGKNGRNQGGWAGEAKGYVNKWGMPEERIWPPRTKDRSLVGNHEVELNAKMHMVPETEELERNNFDALISALLDPERPCPVTMGLNWWGHLVYAVKAVEISSGKFGVKFANSWTENYGQNGCGVLAESKARAFEQLAVIGVKPRPAVDTFTPAMAT